MTKPFTPHVLKPLTAAAACDPRNERAAVVSFAVDADYYCFVLDRTALHRLSAQIDRVLREIPPLSRTQRSARAGHEPRKTGTASK